jgi:hypothetical protein
MRCSGDYERKSTEIGNIATSFRHTAGSLRLLDYASDGLAGSTTTFVPTGTSRWRSIMS